MFVQSVIPLLIDVTDDIIMMQYELFSLFTLPFSSLVCIHLGYLRTDISGIEQASSFHLTHISLSFTVISLTPIFMLFDL